MGTVTFYIVNAFTTQPFKGNSAGVVLNAEGLSERTMQRIAAELKCSETAFVTESNLADVGIRFFTPLREVDLCGHATIAAFHTMREEGYLRTLKTTMETLAGVMKILHTDNMTWMTQAIPTFLDVDIDIKKVAEALGVHLNEIDKRLPMESVSTGLFSLNVPICSLATMEKMHPNFEKVKTICQQAHAGAIFPFTFETLDATCLIHSRCFAPLYGINEDPVTGTANGALGAYLKKHRQLRSDVYQAEQGWEIGRDGIVYVDTKDAITVGGKAHVVIKGSIDIESG